LIAPHGGELVDLLAPADDRVSLESQAAGLATVTLSGARS